MRTFKVSEILTKEEIQRAREIKKAGPICEEIIKPNIARIRARLWQDCDPMYLAYCTEHALVECCGFMEVSNANKKTGRPDPGTEGVAASV